jgi:hypothetical protein
MKYIITILFIIALLGCPKGVSNAIYFVNKSNNANIFLLSISPYCYDSILPKIMPDINIFRPCPINQNMGLTIAFSFGTIKNQIEQSPQKALSFYLFDKTTLDTSTWANIIANNLYLKKYVITPADVNNVSNYTITYP